MHPNVQLMTEYMNEQYAAARHHQALRAQTMSFLLAASAALFGLALGPAGSQHSALIAYALIAISVVATTANFAFYRSNRLHSETATRCRKLLAAKTAGPGIDTPFDKSDPIWVRRDIEREAVFPFYNPDRNAKTKWMKTEYILSAVFHLVPILIFVAGILVLTRKT